MTNLINRIVRFTRTLPSRIGNCEVGIRETSSTIELLRAEIASLKAEITSLGNENEALRKDLLKQTYLTALSANSKTETTVSGEPFPSPSLTPIDEQFKRLEEIVPEAFTEWKKLLEVNLNAYEGFPLHSCSVAGHPSGELFRQFVFPTLRGRVLDIGCGPQPVPLYLENYPIRLVSGIDPISAPDDHPFEFVHGVAEFLPWPDDTFETVVVGTSLDHVLLLDRVYEEVRRVLAPGGNFIIWTVFIKDSIPYDPYRSDISPVDEFHLFHFDREWFEKGIEEFFIIDDVYRVNVDIDHYFYRLQPKNK